MCQNELYPTKAHKSPYDLQFVVNNLQKIAKQIVKIASKWHTCPPKSEKSPQYTVLKRNGVKFWIYFIQTTKSLHYHCSHVYTFFHLCCLGVSQFLSWATAKTSSSHDKTLANIDQSVETVGCKKYIFFNKDIVELYLKKPRIRETPTLSTDADSRTNTNLKRLRDLS